MKQPHNPIYSATPWSVVEEHFIIQNNYHSETIFSIGNGYIGMRGNFEEGYTGPKGTSLQGTYLNGFYESEPIHYGESAYGYAKNNQTMLNVTNSQLIQCVVDGEFFDVCQSRMLHYRRELNFKTGLLIRECVWETQSGKQLKLRFERLISFSDKHLAAIQCLVTPLNFSGEIILRSGLDSQVTNQVCSDDPRMGSHLKGQVLPLIENKQTPFSMAVMQKTNNTQFALVCGMHNELSSEVKSVRRQENQRFLEEFSVSVFQNEPVALTKFISYHTSKDFSESGLFLEAEKTLKAAKAVGFNELVRQQADYLLNFWIHSDIEIEGDPALQQGMRFNQFHLLQSVGRDGKTSISAKGLTGEGYEGHYFWDAESFALPFFLYTKPELAKELLMYRYSTLEKARARAREMAHPKGALFPWRTINGEECSAYYPAGTAHYHINADIIHALKLYYEATNDIDFMLDYGAEMLFETARLWEALGAYIPAKNNQFCINGVTGPDEYTAVVNNNFYTNMMAQSHLQFAASFAEMMQSNYIQSFVALAKKINLTEEEIVEWQRAAHLMYLPYDEELGIHPQDDTFLEKAVWDFAGTPKEKYPLLLHYHPLVIYRHQVCKQADVLLADLWFGHKMTREIKRRDYDYYEPITTHDSSLSPCCFSIMANDVGYPSKAYEYFMDTARLDLDNLHGNSQNGIHAANMAGAWMSMTFGFAGMRTYDGHLSFKPQLPEVWKQYSIRFVFQGRLLKLSVTRDEITFTLLKGDALQVQCFSDFIQLALNESKKLTMAEAEAPVMA